MASKPRARPPWAAVVIPTVVLLVAACTTSGTGGAGTGNPTGASSVPTSTASAPVAPSRTAAASPLASSMGNSKLAVTSSVLDGALTDPVEWIATVTGNAVSDPIDHVDFLVDGAIAWTEHAVPYQFNDDGNLLIPWVLAPGSHQPGINAVTASGASAMTQARITTTRPAVPAALLGKVFVRSMPGGGQTPAGDWRFTFNADGVIAIDDPGGFGANEGFLATSDGTMTLFGPANWIEPADRWGGFCDTADGIAKMHWQLQGTHLVLSSIGTDPCRGRAFLFAGTWTLKP